MSTESTECVTCGNELRGPWCHACGERARDADDLRVRVFAKRAAAGALDLDSRLWRTFRELIRRPGLLTAEFVRGRRQPYLHPLQTFLLANLVFFALLTTVGGFNTFTTQLRYQLQAPLYGETARRVVEREVTPGTEEAEEFAERFDETTPRYANSMVIVMAPILALFLVLLYPRRRGAFVQHVVFALHFMTFLLLLITVIPLALALLGRVAPSIVLGLASSELPIGILLVTCCVLYLVPALRRAYGDRPGPALARALAASLLLLPALLVYRAILFFTVFLVVS